jgi:RNA polymerase sigma-70 factor (ECF subfamily)
MEIEHFEASREKLRRLAYRLLGTVEDADDALQETYLKWLGIDNREIRSPESWLVTAITRICIDRMRTKAREKKFYTGPWLPGPLYVEEPMTAQARMEMTSDLSMALLILLERLSAEERAIYLLRDIFDYPYAHISTVVGKTEAACRQILSRARKHIQEQKPRFMVRGDRQQAVVEKFLGALQLDDENLLMGAIAEDASITSDGGGRVTAALNIIQGRERICRLLLTVRGKINGKIDDRLMLINGEPGIVTYVDNIPRALFFMETNDEQVLSLFRLMNPEKLSSIPRLDSLQ